MLHQPLLFVAAIQNAQLGEDALMRPVQVHALLQQLHDRCKVTTHLHPLSISIDSINGRDDESYLVVMDEVVEVIHKDDDMNTASLCKAELLCIDAGVTNSLPSRNGVGLASSINSLLELIQVHITESKLPEIVHVFVQDTSSFIQTLYREFIAN